MLKTVRILVVLATVAAITTGAVAAPPETEEEKTIYSIGVMISQNLAAFNFTEKEAALVAAGLTDTLLGREIKLDLQEYGPKIQALGQQRAQVAAQAEKSAAVAFLDRLAGEKGAQRMESGLIYFETRAGTGASPAATDKVKVHYHGTLRDGSVFDSSVERGEPITFPLTGVIPCWTEGVQMMKVGGKARLVCPSGIAYGDQGRPPRILPGAALVFDVELLGIE